MRDKSFTIVGGRQPGRQESASIAVLGQAGTILGRPVDVQSRPRRPGHHDQRGSEA